MDDVLNDPGAYAAGSSSLDNFSASLPDSGILPPDTTSGGVDQLLTPTFTPTLSNLESQIPASSMGDLLNSSSVAPSSSSGGNSLDASLLGFGENIGSSLLNAFVITPQNVSTAEGAALQGANITSALSSQWFGYLLIGLVIFLIFGFLERK